MRETAKSKKAFEIYYTMGPSRSLAKVGRKLGITKDQVERWSSAFKWVAKVTDMDQKVSEEAIDDYDAKLKKAHKENFEIIDKVKQIVRKKVEKILKRIDEKGASVDVSLNDFEKIAKLELLMLGDPTERISDETITGVVKSAAESIRKRNAQRRD